MIWLTSVGIESIIDRVDGVPQTKFLVFIVYSADGPKWMSISVLCTEVIEDRNIIKKLVLLTFFIKIPTVFCCF